MPSGPDTPRPVVPASDVARDPATTRVVPPAPPAIGPTASPTTAPAAAPGPAVAPRWVPLVPGAESIPNGLSTRSGAVLMAATRADPNSRAPTRAIEGDLELRSALLGCLEALAPHLEPGWSHCQEHAFCRAVQEATIALWGSVRGPGPVPSSGTPDLPANAARPADSPGAEGPADPSGNPPLLTRDGSRLAGP